MHAPVLGKSNPHILYIDRDAELALLFKSWLEHVGYRVSTEASPRMGLDYLSSHPGECDLVVTDCRMPDFDGIEVAKAIHDHYPGLRCAVVSGNLSSDVIKNASAAGIGPVYQKPFTPCDYEALIKRCAA
jgi:DNA-binding NtrC family response regulator